MGNHTGSFRRSLLQIREGRPGYRFQEYYERSRRSKTRAGTMARIVRISAAVAALAIAAVLSVIPGPAIPFFFLAGALLATESKWVARLMDWIEVRLRRIFAWGQKYWRRFSPVTRAAVVILGGCLSACSAFLVYRFIRG
jgi:hypothetical protein